MYYGKLDRAMFNVTGVTSCVQALKVISSQHDVNHHDRSLSYVSLLSGRMDERSLQANEHLRALRYWCGPRPHLIAGSMRTMSGVEDALRFGAIPTIGTAVWNQVLSSKETLEEFRSMLEMAPPASDESADLELPAVSEKHHQLSREFFEEMNACGLPLYRNIWENS